MQLTLTFVVVLQEFRYVFSQPSFQTFCALMTGWCLSPRRRFVTEFDPVQWFGPRRPSQLLPSLLQPGQLDLDFLWRILARVLLNTFAPTGPGRTGRRRYPVPQTGPDHLRHGHAPRPSHLQSGPQTCQLGTRLGRALPGGPLFLGTEQSLVLAALVPALSQPPRAHQGAQGQKTPARSQPSHPSRTVPPRCWACWRRGFRSASSWSAATVPTRPERLAAPAGQRGPHQPCPSQGGLVRAGTTTVRARGGRGPRERAWPRMAQWAADASSRGRSCASTNFGLHATLAVKTRHALYYKAGKDRLLTIVLVHDLAGQRPEQMFYSTRLDWDARRILASYAPAGPSK